MKINESVSISLKDPSVGTIHSNHQSNNSVLLGYPCQTENLTNSDKCTPYVLELSRGTYQFECWGSVGGHWVDNVLKSTPGYGGYTSGTLFIGQKTTFYVYIGNTGFFNAAKKPENFDLTKSLGYPGGATDVRTAYSDNWWNETSLISRIMVAAGGGGSEWAYSVGGNGGGLEGGPSVSAKDPTSNNTFDEKCEGAKQTEGSNCTNFYFDLADGTNHINVTGGSAAGSFGIAGSPPYPDGIQGFDYGGFGGGGYYGGTSFGYAYAGSGGSSFISGHPNCNSVKNQIPIQHSNSPYHFSGFVFRNTKMIMGNDTMPLPNDPTNTGTHDKGGYFRITLLYINTIAQSHSNIHHLLFVSSLFFISLKSSY